MPVSPPTHQICGTAHWTTQPCPKGTRRTAAAAAKLATRTAKVSPQPAGMPTGMVMVTNLDVAKDGAVTRTNFLPKITSKPPRKAKKATPKPSKPKVRRKLGAERAPAVAQAKAAVEEITSGVDPDQVARRKEQIRRAVAKHRAKQKPAESVPG